jgi:hypothetical protein
MHPITVSNAMVLDLPGGYLDIFKYLESLPPPGLGQDVPGRPSDVNLVGER